MKKSQGNKPFFSVVIPTFERPALLRRAIQTVQDQSFTSWEIVVCDDDPADNPSWQLLNTLAEEDPRIRPIKNSKSRGQPGCINSAIEAAQGAWVKPLDDDDYLNPGCLETLHRYLSNPALPSSVGFASFCKDTVTDGTIKQWHKGPAQPEAELIEKTQALMAMYLFENVGGIIPSCICLRRSLVTDNGLWMPHHPDLLSTVDCHWFALLANQADLLVLNQALITKQDWPDSITGRISDQAIDKESEKVIHIQSDLLPEDQNHPPAQIIAQAYFLMRAGQRLLSRGNILAAVRLAMRAWHPGAWWIAIRKVLQRQFPSLHGVPRSPLILEPYDRQGNDQPDNAKANPATINLR